jgi:molecular chaperone GrpE
MSVREANGTGNPGGPESSGEDAAPASAAAEGDGRSEAESELATLRKEVADLTARLRTVSAAYKNLQDDMHAFKSRTERQLTLREEVLRGDTVRALFEPLENLRRAVDAERSGGDAALVAGLEAVVATFLDGFKQLGLEEYGQAGDRFDPSAHEALSTVPVSEDQDGTVTEVFSRGYRVGTRVIRAARVVVGQYDPPAGEA